MAEQLIYESKKSKIYLVDDGEWDKSIPIFVFCVDETHHQDLYLI